MKRNILKLLLLCFPILAIAQQTINASIMHEGLERDYILYIPASYSPDQAAPLVLNFHGYTSNATEQMFYGDFRSIADTAGFLIAHPMGTVDGIGNTHWNVGWGASTVDDVGFTEALIDTIATQYNINDKRIYSTGMSNGGFMSYQLACKLSHRIAAIASVTGSMNNNQFNDCNPDHPMPIMEIHGTADDVVAYGGSFLFAPIENVLSFWVDFNQCDLPASIYNLEDINPNDESTAEQYVFENGNNGATVEHYKIINGGHTWPGANFVVGVTNYDMHASTEIWRFFSKYDLDGSLNTTSVKQLDKALAKLRIYPNPAQSFITLENENLKSLPYELSTLVGQSILSGVIDSDNFKLDISSLPQGVYLLKLENRVFKILKNG